MAVSRRYDISGNSVVYRAADMFSAQPRSVRQDEDVWPLRRAVWLWAGFSAAGWALIAALVS